MSITIEHLYYSYQKTSGDCALRDINLELPDRQFAALIGHTGSGKSTLASHLNGLLRAQRGRIYYNGQDIYDRRFRMSELRSRVGLVFQYPEHQLFEADVFTDVCFGPRNQGLAAGEAESRAREAMRLVGLDERYEKLSPFELSGGEKKRAAIAGVLAMRPEVLVLDEPTAGLDPAGREELLGQLSRLQRERGMTVLLVSHSMEDVARYADRLIVMNRGEIFLDGTPGEVFRHVAELEEIGLAVPKVSSLMRRLADRGWPVDTGAITVEQARDEILRCLRERGGAP